MGYHIPVGKITQAHLTLTLGRITSGLAYIWLGFSTPVFVQACLRYFYDQPLALSINRDPSGALYPWIPVDGPPAFGILRLVYRKDVGWSAVWQDLINDVRTETPTISFAAPHLDSLDIQFEQPKPPFVFDPLIINSLIVRHADTGRTEESYRNTWEYLGDTTNVKPIKGNWGLKC